MSDFDELMAVLDLHQKADDVFVGTHPSKNPPRTFGGLMMAQSFVAAARTRTRDLPPNSLSAAATRHMPCTGVYQRSSSSIALGHNEGSSSTSCS